jgi:hypothetical protein
MMGGGPAAGEGTANPVPPLVAAQLLLKQEGGGPGGPHDQPAAHADGGEMLMAAGTPAAPAAAAAEDDDARAIKRPRLIWTSALHKRFLEAMDKCGGVDKSLPKAIMKVRGGVGWFC